MPNASGGHGYSLNVMVPVEGGEHVLPKKTKRALRKGVLVDDPKGIFRDNSEDAPNVTGDVPSS